MSKKTLRRLEQHIRQYFNVHTVRQGEEYYRRGKVRSVILSQADELSGRVCGSYGHEYTAALQLSPTHDRIEATDCSCSEQTACKHTVAVALYYTDEALEKERQQEEFSYEDLGISSLMIHEAVKGSAAYQSEDTETESEDVSGEIKYVEVEALKDPPRDLLLMLNRMAETMRQKAQLQYESERNALERAAAERSSERRNILVYVLSSLSKSSRPQIERLKVAVMKDGSFGTATKVRNDLLLQSPSPSYVEEIDREIARMSLSLDASGSRYSFYYGDAAGIHSSPELLSMFLKPILTTGRCYFESFENGPLLEGPTLSGRFAWIKSGEEYRLQVLATDEKGVDHHCLRWRFPWYVDEATWTVGPVQLEIPSELVSIALELPPVRADDIPGLAVTLADLGLHKYIPLPTSGEQFDLRLILPTPCLDVGVVNCVLPMTLPNGLVVGTGEWLKVALMTTKFPRPERLPYRDKSGKLVVEKHDTSLDAMFSERLQALGFVELPPDLNNNFRAHAYFAFPRTGDWLYFIEHQIPLLRAEGWEIATDTESKVKPVEMNDSDISIDVRTDGGSAWWFSLEITIEINGRRLSLLPILVQAIRRLYPRGFLITPEAIERLNTDGKFVTSLHDGTMISIPFDRIRSILLSLQELLWKEKTCAPRIKASLMNVVALLQHGLDNARWNTSKEIKELVEKIRNGAVKLVSPPRQFNTILRPYQLEGLSWMQFLAEHKFGGILADDMGLGKTVQVLAHICLEKEAGRLENPFLVVCPTSVLPNWISETEKFAPHLKTLSLYGSERFCKFGNVEDADIVVTTYPLIARDGQFYKTVDWHGIALDEAQFVKNPDTQAATILRQLKANHRFCVTGTPIENHLGDLWAHFHFLIPDLLGERSYFNKHVREPIEKAADVRMRQVVARRVAPFMLRRTKTDVAAELPKKSIIIKCIQLEGEQRDLYETVRLATQKRIREEINDKGILHSQIVILEALLRLRQTCCDPRLVKLELARKVKQSAKLDQLIEMISELHEQERKMLVFSQFTSMLDLVASELKQIQIPFVELRGSTVDRAAPVRAFQEGKVPAFLISLRAGGTGLNLTAADTVIHYDPWWNPAVEAQATDRAHRIGQTKNVFVYKLIAEGTIEQRMLELQETKGRLARGIFEDAEISAPPPGGFTEEDLDMLLRPMEKIEMRREAMAQARGVQE